ncbi:hypothetical protein N7539_000039 [Penicillium diatomitis]|uniref:Uncharacterized protein n=1 Tax=Penicillium diatomitis TaxID=2819901 RepID=A0A9W9XL77_9EURO|nr:uncharacterized protein N7539_000039 [Penicillium diatomitis]KAJ5494923.1 hypothetical protein N7539_000039 [Penicillium diatomitis]
MIHGDRGVQERGGKDVSRYSEDAARTGWMVKMARKMQDLQVALSYDSTITDLACLLQLRRHYRTAPVWQRLSGRERKVTIEAGWGRFPTPSKRGGARRLKAKLTCAVRTVPGEGRLSS